MSNTGKTLCSALIGNKKHNNFIKTIIEQIYHFIMLKNFVQKNILAQNFPSRTSKFRINSI